jgi:hypothetical protein
MATHYKGERIDELLGEIATLQDKLNRNIGLIDTEENLHIFSNAYTALVLAKAKLTALQGELL